jgi:MscS family membrane protein
MNRLGLFLVAGLLWLAGVASVHAADVAPVVAAAPATEAAARPAVTTPDFLEHMVDVVLDVFHVRNTGNSIIHYVISALMLAVALLARQIVTRMIFPVLRRFAEKTETTLDDKLFPAMEAPSAAFVVVVGIFAALKVLKLSPEIDHYIGYGSRVAFSLVIFWGLWRAFSAVLDHATEVAQERQLGIATFMPWVRKSLAIVFIAVGILLLLQSLGYDVKAVLAGLGIGGFAFALAAQDTLANIFGALVVAVDQPFRVGETVKIGANTGTVEDIGLRSTRIRLTDRSLMTVPNKMVASETITNLSRFSQRRSEQVLGLTYDAKPEQLSGLTEEIRQLILREAEVDPASVMVYFRDLNASSLDLWVVYVARDPDLQQFMRLRQRLNLEFMRAVETRGLAFAFPTQTLHIASAPGPR